MATTTAENTVFSGNRRVSTDFSKGNHLTLKQIYEQKYDQDIPPEESQDGFYSRYFLVPKKGTQALRPILDLGALNRCLIKYKVRMLTYSTLLKFTRPGEKYMCFNLRDAYFHIRIYSPHRKFLCLLSRA